MSQDWTTRYLTGKIAIPDKPWLRKVALSSPALIRSVAEEFADDPEMMAHAFGMLSVVAGKGEVYQEKSKQAIPQGLGFERLLPRLNEGQVPVAPLKNERLLPRLNGEQGVVTPPKRRGRGRGLQSLRGER
jgi:hypothetical protein